jgi:lipopolysaccharide/colanic/teichoic acid biosynthesis glycosyltransferase
MAKRLVDLIGSTISLVLLSPLFLGISLLILADSGRPVLFMQERLGLNGRRFLMFKFRSMRTGSHAVHLLNPDGSLKASAEDAQITNVGKWLRKCSLDELPQLINVLIGEMSLVGPRPDLPFHRGYYSAEEARKLTAKPGITGLAQVSGRNMLPWKERLRRDLEYVDSQSLMLDLRILWQTVGRVVRAEGIYQERPGKGEPM